VTGYPWLGTALLALPGAGLGVAAGFAGIATASGIALAAGAAAYVLVGLYLLQPWVESSFAELAGESDAAGQFLQRALAFTSVDEIAREYRMAVRKQLGAERSFLIAPTPSGEVVAIGTTDTVHLDGASEAFAWLGDQRRPLARADLQPLTKFAGARATLLLLERLQADVVLPLIHRGVLLGLGVIGGGAITGREAEGFYRAMRAATTAAMANTYLDAEARGGQRLARTFDLATAMQESLMPDDKVVRRPTFELRGVFAPVAACGGDLWSWRELGKGRLLLVIADATGHGAAPALLAAVAKGAIDACWQLLGAELDPGALLGALNKSIYRVGRTRYMMTAFAAVLDKNTETLRFANAAQNFPFFITSAGGKPRVEALVARGNTLGAAPEAVYETHARPMRMGDKLVMYTDGIIDAESPTSGQFGERRLRAAIQAMAHERATRIPELLMAEIDRYTAQQVRVDDITMCAAEFGPTEQERRA
jgi:serine phosphatase RsbU (regulator of sigma subunit)